MTKTPLMLAMISAALLAAPQVFAEKAPDALKCAAPVLNVPAVGEAGYTHYTVKCVGANANALTPTIQFSGEIRAAGGAPYAVRATYTVDGRAHYARALELDPELEQLYAGHLVGGVDSVTALPKFFERKTRWDAHSAVLSVEDAPGLWRALSLQFRDSGVPYLMDAGVGSAPVVAGQSKAELIFSKAYSRFAAETYEGMPRIEAKLSVRNGVLELDVGATRVSNERVMTEAMAKLDANPRDIARAWVVAAQAQFLGLEQEVRYAEQKVAAHHPQLLAEFHSNVRAIAPYRLPVN